MIAHQYQGGAQHAFRPGIEGPVERKALMYKPGESAADHGVRKARKEFPRFERQGVYGAAGAVGTACGAA